MCSGISIRSRGRRETHTGPIGVNSCQVSCRLSIFLSIVLVGWFKRTVEQLFHLTLERNSPRGYENSPRRSGRLFIRHSWQLSKCSCCDIPVKKTLYSLHRLPVEVGP